MAGEFYSSHSRFCYNRFMNWEELESEVDSLAKKINLDPDIIVGIVRGGIIPARLLSNKFNVKEMYCLTVRKVGDRRLVTTEIKEDIQGKKALLVEDMLETGRSLIAARQYLEVKGAIVKTACLYTMPISEIKVDYSLKEINEDVSFPWEK
jgi:hypothetical protein